jgi:hypothetical protein
MINSGHEAINHAKNILIAFNFLIIETKRKKRN